MNSSSARSTNSRQLRPALSLYIPRNADTLIEENRTPRPRSTRSTHSASSQISENRSPASQNHRLPMEILTDIFLHCLPTTHEVPPPCLTSQAPLSLVSVCREWRSIALNIPRLWSSPHIRLPPPTAYMSTMGLQLQLDGIELWLRRSGSTLPLSFSLMIYRGLEHSDAELHANTVKLIQLLMQHSHRITHLGIFSLQTLQCLLYSFSTIGSVELLTLKSIYMRLVGRKSITKGEVLVDIMSRIRTSMPVLQELSIDGLTSNAARHLTRTRSWSTNITQLVLGSAYSSSSHRRSGPESGSSTGQHLGPSDILSILSHNPQLQSFQAIIMLHTHRTCTSFAKLPSLLNLNVRFVVPPNDALIPYPDQDIYRFFEHTSCPALRTLSVVYAGIPSLTEVPFLSWISAPFSQHQNSGSSELPGFGMPMAKLRELRLEMSMTTEALTTCLVLLPPSIRVLEIVDLGQIDIEGAEVVFGHTVKDSHLELLTWQPLTSGSTDESVVDKNVSSVEQGYDICPRLKTFRLIVSGFLSPGYSTPTPRSSTSSLQSLSDWKKKRIGVSRAALHRLIESRKPTLLSSTEPVLRKQLRECEVFLSPTLSTYYMLDSPGS